VTVLTLKTPFLCNQRVKYEYQYYNHPEDNRQLQDGWYHNYFENGQYKQIGTYKEDLRNGKWVTYYDSGKVYWKGYYVDGKKSGQWLKDFQFGMVVGNYVDGKEEGMWFLIDGEGNLSDEDIWEGGECVEMCEGDEQEPVPYFLNQ
jgi:antitoxin component YwqK of YwqJK toxin-antitoxin module